MIVGALLITVAVACGDDGSAGSGTPKIVVTTTILGDIADDVVGDQGSVDVLMPIGADPHEFALSVRQAAALQSADLIIANGLDYEEGLLDAIAAAETAGVPVLRLAEQLDPRPFADQADDNADGSTLDPHWFTDPVRMADAAGLMADALVDLTDADPAVTDRAASVGRTLLALDDEVRSILAPIEPENRNLVTGHDVFAYFADRYDLTVVGTVVPGGTTLAETTPSELTDLIDTIERLDIPAVFVETTSSTDLAEALADEVGRSVAVVPLYTESLGELGSDGATYEEMIATDARRIADGLT